MCITMHELIVINILLLQCNGQDISWNHLKDVYNANNDISTGAPGLRLIPKLKYEDINLMHLFLKNES